MQPGSLDTLLRRLDVLESQDAIRRLKAAYMQGCDERIGARIADLFWDDGVWQGPSGSAQGRAEIARMFADAPNRLTFTVHYLTNESIEVAGDVATGRWKLLEPCTYRDRLALWMAGSYVDEFERRDGVWRLRRLSLDIAFRTPYEDGWHRRRHADLAAVDTGIAADGQR